MNEPDPQNDDEIENRPFIDQNLLKRFVKNVVDRFNDDDKREFATDFEYSDDDDDNPKFVKFGNIPKKYVKKLIYDEVVQKNYLAHMVKLQDEAMKAATDPC